MPVTTVDARITDIHMENFIKSSDKPVTGMVEARAVLTGRGNSVHKVAASASGTADGGDPVRPDPHSLAEWLGINVLNALSLTLCGRPQRYRSALRRGAFQRQGRRPHQPAIRPRHRSGAGGWAAARVDLKDETVDLHLQGKPKHFQLFRLRAPITRQRPAAASRCWAWTPGPALTQGAIGAGLAVVNPLAAILAFIDPGLAKNANCAGLLGHRQSAGRAGQERPQ